jgi:hypothetical protein
MERPLDTIRSFEAAIDGSYRQRFSRIGMIQDILCVAWFADRADHPTEPQDSTFGQSRRSSYYQGMCRCCFQVRLGQTPGMPIDSPRDCRVGGVGPCRRFCLMLTCLSWPRVSLTAVAVLCSLPCSLVSRAACFRLRVVFGQAMLTAP